MIVALSLFVFLGIADFVAGQSTLRFDSCESNVVSVSSLPVSRLPERGPFVPAKDQETYCQTWGWPDYTLTPIENGFRVELTGHFFAFSTPRDILSCLDAGSDPNVRSTIDGHVPLHFASYYGDVALVRAFLRAGADPNLRESSNASPLHYAVVFNDNAEVTEALLEGGADPNSYLQYTGRIRTIVGTPLHLAAAYNPNPDIATVLLRAGADPNDAHRSYSAHGETPLHSVRYNADDDASFVAVLLEGGADPNARTQAGSTPLHYAASGLSIEDVKQLIQAGSNVRARDLRGRTPLHAAAMYSPYPSVVDVLIDAGADRDAGYAGGLTPLHLAAFQNTNVAVVEALLEAGADPNAAVVGNSEDDVRYFIPVGSTSLHTAVTHNCNPLVVVALLQGGADTDAMDGEGKTAWDRATERDFLKGTDAYWSLNDARRH